jgi:hypothetical protein
MGGIATKLGVARGALTHECAVLHQRDDMQYSRSLSLLYDITSMCPPSIVPPCASQVFDCTMFGSSPNDCALCILGTPANTTNASRCRAILEVAGVHTICVPCPDEVAAINRIVFAITVVGYVSVVACLLVILIIVAYGNDRRSMRDRIVIGLMIANAIFSRYEDSLHCQSPPPPLPRNQLM